MEEGLKTDFDDLLPPDDEPALADEAEDEDTPLADEGETLH